MSLPHTTEQVLWGDDLVFKIGGKMYAGMPLSPARIQLSFKCTPEEFAELIERPGIIPAPYAARALPGWRWRRWTRCRAPRSDGWRACPTNSCSRS